MNFEIEARAASFAAEAHMSQFRKYTGEPYIVHPCAVAGLVREVPHTPEMMAAAWLHDVLEDCVHVSEWEIESAFGIGVLDLVLWLTDKSQASDGNRAARKAKDRERIAKAPAEAQTIKLADLIHNTGSIIESGDYFAKVYLPEKSALLNVLDKGDPSLWAAAAISLKLAWSHVFGDCSTMPELTHPSKGTK